MSKSALEIVDIVRNVTGRVDASDPLFTNEIMIQRVNDFISLISTQEVRLYKNQTWWEFTLSDTDPDPYPVPLQTLVLANGNVGASTIGPPAYADGFYVFWYQDPADFYRIWPETQTYTPSRPQYVLYYNNSLTFRNPPNRDYEIKIQAYQVEVQIDPESGLNEDYLYRYIAYGTSLDIFSDFGEMDKWNEVYPAFKRYKALVYSRTNCQYQNQRAGPDF